MTKEQINPNPDTTPPAGSGQGETHVYLGGTYPPGFAVVQRATPLTPDQIERARAGLQEQGIIPRNYVGRRHFTEIENPPDDLAHATDEYVNATPQESAKLGLKAPGGGKGRKAPGVPGDIASK